ncbi:MAG: hypothetical protein M3Z02_09350 [Actinomycetota bacterium]|nr:hypothetical protein [Actinomycetota bacterium]
MQTKICRCSACESVWWPVARSRGRREPEPRRRIRFRLPLPSANRGGYRTEPPQLGPPPGSRCPSCGSAEVVLTETELIWQGANTFPLPKARGRRKPS